jgi:hypothetical protein
MDWMCEPIGADLENDVVGRREICRLAAARACDEDNEQNERQ